MRPFLFLIAIFSPSLVEGLATFHSQVIPISKFFNNRAASFNGSNGEFTQTGKESFNAALLPTNSFEYDGVTYTLPNSWGKANDNIVQAGQTIVLPTPTVLHELHFLFSGDGSDAQSQYAFNLTFADASTQTVAVTGKGWWAIHNQNAGALEFPYHFENGGINHNLTIIQQWSTAIDTVSPLVSVTLPPESSSNRLHVFAMSSTPAVRTNAPLSSAIAIRRVRFTSNWEQVGNQRAQVVEVTIANMLPQGDIFTTKNSLLGAFSIEVTGNGLQTIRAGVVNRLVPSDQARVNVLVVNTNKQDLRASNPTATVKIMDPNGRMFGSSSGWASSSLRTSWPADPDILKTHETPVWWNQAKYGIFIHWGVYSAPAWAPPENYAEWYDWYLHNPPNESNPFWVHHLETYGANVVYDDFIANFTAANFNASQWIDLFTNAGAKYFVLVSKHHDGFALFDTKNTTHRNSVAMGPHRDLVSELLTTSRTVNPDMHGGTYYSLPEWFNPDYAKYGIETWPGGLAHNAFNQSELEPYTGRVPINDYLEDLLLPQMLSLDEDYDVEMMWCDIGQANKSPEFASEYFTRAWNKGRQVTLNNRCGAPYDFDTPEYTTFPSVQVRSWETSRGMDPFSYGLKLPTPPEDYIQPADIIQTLVDIISHNGNFLLDVGPTADGQIIAPEMNNLLAAGKWLEFGGPCVYSTSYWFRSSQENDLRFVTTPSTFCIVSLTKPVNEQVVVNTITPIVDGDLIELLGSDGTKLNWTKDAKSGKLTIDVPQQMVDSVQYAWPFRVTYAIPK